jgi:hypothetical protein
MLAATLGTSVESAAETKSKSSESGSVGEEGGKKGSYQLVRMGGSTGWRRSVTEVNQKTATQSPRATTPSAASGSGQAAANAPVAGGAPKLIADSGSRLNKPTIAIISVAATIAAALIVMTVMFLFDSKPRKLNVVEVKPIGAHTSSAAQPAVVLDPVDIDNPSTLSAAAPLAPSGVNEPAGNTGNGRPRRTDTATASAANAATNTNAATNAQLTDLEEQLRSALSDRGLNVSDLFDMSATMGATARRWRNARRANNDIEAIQALGELITAVAEARINTRLLQLKLNRANEALTKTSKTAAPERLADLKERLATLKTTVRPGLSDSELLQLTIQAGALEQEISALR